MTRYWSEIVERLEPYTPGEQPRDQQYLKLNTNESPFPPAPAVNAALQQFASADLRRYPDPESRELVAALADYHGIEAEQVFVGNGSDEVLAHAFHALFQQARPILFPDISYSFYPVYCRLYRIDYRQIPLDDAFRLRVSDYAGDNGGVIVPNPNAPTGIALALDDIMRLLQANRDAAVIIDEAYVDFGADSALALLDDFDNLLVVRTFSKSRSLAGLRLGYALGHAGLIEALQRVKNSFNSYPVDRLTSALGIASLRDEKYFRQCIDKIVANRDHLANALEELGFEVFPSSSNFIFVRHPTAAAESLYRELRAADILVRYFSAARIDNCLRITVGSKTECDALIETLHKIVAPG